MIADDRQRIYVEGLRDKIHLLEKSVATQRLVLEQQRAAIGALEEQQRALILRTHAGDAEIARLRAALKPFAEVAKRVTHMSHEGAALVSVSDCRAAQKALETVG